MAFREGAVVKVALLSRVLMLIIAVICGEAFNDFDDSSNMSSAAPTKLEGMMDSSLGHLAKWDAVYFLDIAQYGYRFEHFHAFFPALPMAISFLNNTFLKVLWVKGLMSQYHSAVLAGVLVTNTLFVLSAIELYRLSMRVLRKDSLASKAVLLYCITPANIFMSSIYSESVFAYFFLRGVRLLAEQKRWEAALTLAGTCLTRSNGAVCCLFFAWDALRRCPPPFLQPLARALFGRRLALLAAERPSWTRWAAVWLGAALRCAIVVAPLVAYLGWSYARYCRTDELEHGRPEWCDAWLPNIYTHVQAKYWNVGFLQYYEWKQIPNFLLAMPIVLLSSWGILTYLTGFSFLEAPPASSSSSSSSSPSSSSSSSSSSSATESAETTETTDGTTSGNGRKPSSPYTEEEGVAPFILYWACLVVAGLLFMHVQVLTRFLAACPPLYWFCASFFEPVPAANVGEGTQTATSTSTINSSRQVRQWMQFLIPFYFLAYGLVGALLFCNFYPWT